MHCLDLLELQIAHLKEKMEYLRRITPFSHEPKILYSVFEPVEGFTPPYEVRWETTPRRYFRRNASRAQFG